MTERKHPHHKEYKPPKSVEFLQKCFSKYGKKFPRLMSRVGLYYWTKTTHYRAPSIETETAKRATETFIKIEKKPIKILTWGEQGPAILFLHGWSGRGTQIAYFVEPLLQAGFRVITFDGPGHGDNPGNKINVANYFKQMGEIIKQLQPFHAVIAHSFGTFVFNEIYSDDFQVNHIVFLAPPKDINTPINVFSWLFHMPDETRNYFVRRVNKLYRNYDVDKLSLAESVHQIKKPALIIQDKNDSMVPLEDAEAIVKNWPTATLLITENLGHNGILQDPEVIKRIIDFLQH